MAGKLSKSGKEVVNDQAVIRAMYPRDTAKWVARLFGIPVRTARFWSERSLPIYRRADIGLVLLEEYYRKRKSDEENILPELLKMAGLANEVEILDQAPGLANTAADLVEVAADAIEAAIDWIEG